MLIVGALMATPASAVPFTPQTYVFNGVCSDCTGTAVAELVLSNYALGSAITTSNFVSFTYNGTNLLPGYTVTTADTGLFVSGLLPVGLPSTANVQVFSSTSGKYFTTSSTGSWSVGTPPSDFGSSSSWAGAAGAATPEPASAGLMGLGLLGITALVRRRKQG